MKQRNKLAQASKNSTVSTFGADALMSKNNKSVSSRKSETQVVQDCRSWKTMYST